MKKIILLAAIGIVIYYFTKKFNKSLTRTTYEEYIYTLSYVDGNRVPLFEKLGNDEKASHGSWKVDYMNVCKNYYGITGISILPKQRSNAENDGIYSRLMNMNTEL